MSKTKQVRLRILEKQSKLYDFCSDQEIPLGKELMEYLSLKYSYSVLINQIELGNNLSSLEFDNKILSKRGLKFDYEKKLLMLENLLKNLKNEYAYILSYLNNSEYSPITEIVYMDRDETHNVESVVDEDSEEDDSDSEEDEYDKAIRSGQEPDPNNPGYTKDGLLVW